MWLYGHVKLFLLRTCLLVIEFGVEDRRTVVNAELFFVVEIERGWHVWKGGELLLAACCFCFCYVG